MEQGAFLDLTPYVTGDALKEYKNLATFPDYMWNNVKFKGKIYGVPKPLQRNGNIAFYRGDWAKKLGKGAPKSPDERARPAGRPSPRATRTATARPTPGASAATARDWNGWDDARVANNMFGVPFNWRKNADGTLTHQIETDEFRQAIDYLRQLYADGAFHPDAAGMTFAQCQGAYLAGKIGIHSEGFGNFVSPNVAGTRLQQDPPGRSRTRSWPGCCRRRSAAPRR